MKLAWLPLLALLLAGHHACEAEDITTLDGKTYANVTISQYLPEGVVILVKGQQKGIKYANLPPDLRFKYQCELAMSTAAKARVTLKLTDAFRLSQLEEAKKKAIAEGKPLGFIMVWDQYFGQATGLVDQGGPSGTAHFHHVFKDQLVLVFVRHEDELDKVPKAVKQGFSGPDEGGFAPNMAVVDPKAETFFVEIPYGGKESNGAIREKVFRAGIEKILAAKEQWMKAPEPAKDAGVDAKKGKAAK